ncbi:hypothetical protein [Phenylobacterium sp.]|jgi:hypothetical protein|uniref:hypothetical protein n=1 Tax=Phenylobacterium sp. TaxID=1871053 RepID=UPI002F405AC4
MQNTAIARPASGAAAGAASLSARLAQDLAPFDVRPARTDGIRAARAFAAQLIGEGIVTAHDLERVHALSGEAALYTTREDGALTGVLAFVLLNAAGLKAVREGGFDALSPAAAHVAGPGERACAFYGWGVAATTKTSARRVIDGARAIMAGAVGHLPKFARPTTEAGHRLMRERLGFVDLPGCADDLVWQPALEEAIAA